MGETKRESTARDYLTQIIGLDETEVDLLEENGHDPEYIAQAAALLFDQNGTTLTIDEVRQKIRDQYPEAFNYRIVLPTNGADIAEFEPHFLWKPYIPLNDYTVLYASGGSGKTFACNWIAAQITKGGFIKGDTDFYSQEEAKRTGKYPDPGNVLYISSEEEEGLIRERFIKSGGDQRRLYVLDRNKSLDMNFTDGHIPFTLSVQSCNPRLVIIDPIQAFLGKSIDMNRKNQLRPAMQRLATIAKKCNCGIILVSHVNKKDQSTNINYAVSGSTDIVDAARSALMVIQDPEERDGRILVHTKANYSALADSLKFHITPNGGFVYDGISMITRDVIEDANRKNKSLSDYMAQQGEERTTKEDLIDAIKELAVPGKSIIIAYDEMIDTFGDSIFGGASRPGSLIKKVIPALKQCGIEIEMNTVNGKPKKKRYKDKSGAIGFEIYQKPQKGEQHE